MTDHVKKAEEEDGASQVRMIEGEEDHEKSDKQQLASAVESPIESTNAEPPNAKDTERDDNKVDGEEESGDLPGITDDDDNARTQLSKPLDTSEASHVRMIEGEEDWEENDKQQQTSAVESPKESTNAEQPDAKDKERDANKIDGEEESCDVPGLKDDDDVLKAQLSKSLDKSERDKLYSQACELEARGSKAVALTCLLHCLRDLTDTQQFSYLPQCLHKIADIYYGMEDFAKAVQFIQAEKLYYETALIDTNTMETKATSDRSEPGKDAGIAPEVKADVIRGDEYENLARICLERKQPHLALEYQAKATKFRQQAFGDDHELTIKSLDFFTVLYGEVGKQQYQESMQRFEVGGTVNDQNETPVGQSTSETTRVTQDPNVKQREEWVSHALLWALFFICSSVLLVIMLFLYCKLDQSSSCEAWRNTFHYYYIRSKYYYFYYTSSSKNAYG